MSVRTRRAGTAFGIYAAPVPSVPRLHQVVLPTPWEVGPVQVYVVDAEPLTLIDTGVATPESFGVLEAALRSLGHEVGSVRRVLLTHYHGDHLGQAQSLRRVAGDLEVGAHADEVAMIEGFSPLGNEQIAEHSELFRDHGVDETTNRARGAWLRERVAQEPVLCEATEVDRVLRDGDRVEFDDFALTVHHVPGHTAGHVVYEHAESGTFLTGDHVMGGAVPSTTSFYTRTAPDPDDPLGRRPRFRGLPAYLSSLRRLRSCPVRTLLPSHGGVLPRGERAIDEALLFYDVRIQRIERGLRSLAALGHDVTAWELFKALFPKADPVKGMRNRMLMVIGALDVLEERGQCVSYRRDDGVLLHRHAPLRAGPQRPNRSST